jgi:hypothetical protein
VPQILAGQIGLLLFNAGVSLAVVNAVTLTIVPALINLGIGLAVSAAAAALQNRRTPIIKPSDGQQEIRQEVPPRRKSYGTVRLSGPIFFSETVLASQELLYIGVLVNHGRIGSFIDYWIDDNQVEIDGSGNVTTAPYTDVDILTRLGAAAETQYQQIEDNFAVSEFRGDGTASVLIIYDSFADAETQLENYPGGIPRFRTTISGSVVYDPRDQAQDTDDETTWESSDNPIVCLFTYCFLDPDGYGIPFSWVEDNLAEWEAAMDSCDEMVTLASAETEKRYRLAMSFDLTEDPKDVAQRILAACDGRMWPRRDGSMGISVGVFETPTITIGPEAIVGCEMQRGRDRLDKIMGVRAQYMSPDHDYLEQEADLWPNGADVVTLVEERIASLDLTMVPSHSQARRLMKREYVRNTGGWHGTVICNLAGIRARDERFIRLVVPALEIDESFELIDYLQDLDEYRVTLEVSAVPASIDDWDPAEEEGTPPDTAPGLEEAEIDREAGTDIGNMTQGGGLAAAFDGETSESPNQCSRQDTPGWVGKTLAAPTRIARARIYSSNNSGYCEDDGAGQPNITLQLYAKQGAAPSSSTDGTLLGSTGSFGDSNTSLMTRDIISNDIATEYDHVWVRVSKSSGAGERMLIGELQLWEWLV